MRQEIATRCQHIINAGNNARQVWSNIKDLLYTGHPTDETNNDTTFCSKLAVFFAHKVNNIKATIAWSLAGLVYDPLASDRYRTLLHVSIQTDITRDLSCPHFLLL